MNAVLKACAYLLPLLFLAGCKVAPVYISKIEGSKIIKLDKTGVKAEVFLRIKNPNSMGFKIHRTAFDCELNDIPVGKAYLKKKIRVKANSDDVHTFVIESDFSKLGLKELALILNLATAKSVKVHVKGNVKVGKFLLRKEFPIDVTQTVSL
ncbi:MAG: LEA type 2 family protein [Bacteroidia bacterium]|nr:LEA type 2 family protein [Bacteroidia bacterium]